ncbi:MAG TPA: response regulator [Terriglobales bacterium]|nr:response regulator [Terriglobales bacterium]
MSRKPSLLIVDDEVSVARTLQMVFEQEGYKVAAAYSCAEALHLLNNGGRYDAIITDLNMEQPDIGLDVARAAGGLSPRPVVVICTGYASSENSRTALELRVDYLATKPVDLKELVPALNRMLCHRRDLRVWK